MRVSKRYVDRRVSDVFEEIQQQGSFLDALEKRVETLREQVDHLRKSYEEVETLESITMDLPIVSPQPPLEDVHLFADMDSLNRHSAMLHGNGQALPVRYFIVNE